MSSEAIANVVIDASIYAGTGVFVSQMTKKILTPSGGAAFGVVAYLSGKVIREGLDKFFGDSSAEKILKIAGEHFGGMLIALGTALKTGFKINLMTSMTLALWMVPITYATTKVVLPIIRRSV